MMNAEEYYAKKYADRQDALRKIKITSAEMAADKPCPGCWFPLQPSDKGGK